MIRRPRRRDVLLGGAGAAGALVLAGRARAAAVPAPVVDVHCHTFCSSDLPIVGFVAHHIPGLTELSRFLTRWPELVVRALVRAAATLPNAAGPSAAEELASLQALGEQPARGLIGPVPSLSLIHI